MFFLDSMKSNKKKMKIKVYISKSIGEPEKSSKAKKKTTTKKKNILIMNHYADNLYVCIYINLMNAVVHNAAAKESKLYFFEFWRRTFKCILTKNYYHFIQFIRVYIVWCMLHLIFYALVWYATGCRSIDLIY